MKRPERLSSSKRKTDPDLRILADKVKALQNDRQLKARVDARVKEFSDRKLRRSDREWFSELCFCILTANSTAKLGMRLQEEIGTGCIDLPEKSVQSLLKSRGHRFHTKRAEYICRAREHIAIVGKVEAFPSERDAREWLASEITGLGYKEASHFLRNTGHLDVAILDRHILNIMHEHGLIDRIPESLTPRRYIEIEKRLESLSESVGMPLGILDMYLWYMKTGDVLK